MKRIVTIITMVIIGLVFPSDLFAGRSHPGIAGRGGDIGGHYVGQPIDYFVIFLLSLAVFITIIGIIIPAIIAIIATISTLATSNKDEKGDKTLQSKPKSDK